MERMILISLKLYIKNHEIAKNVTVENFIIYMFSLISFEKKDYFEKLQRLI